MSNCEAEKKEKTERKREKNVQGEKEILKLPLSKKMNKDTKTQ